MSEQNEKERVHFQGGRRDGEEREVVRGIRWVEFIEGLYERTGAQWNGMPVYRHVTTDPRPHRAEYPW